MRPPDLQTRLRYSAGFRRATKPKLYFYKKEDLWVSIQRHRPTMGWGARIESAGTGDGLWSNWAVPHNHKFYTGVFLCHHFITLWPASGVVEFVNVSLVSGQRRMERAGLGSDDWCCGPAVPSNTPRLFLLCLFNFRGKMAPVHSLGWIIPARRKPESLLTLCGSSSLSQPAGKHWLSPQTCFHFIWCFSLLVPAGWVAGRMYFVPVFALFFLIMWTTCPVLFV